MASPVTFDSISPRLHLPLLFAGQAQKELFVNEALSIADALLHCAIESSTATPPATPGDGQNWLIGATPTGDWSGHSGEIACRQSGSWIFALPVDGMKVLNRSTGQFMVYRGGWNTAATPNLPTGGTTIDSEARAAINQIVAALKIAGVLATS